MTWHKKDFDQILETLKSRVAPQLTDFEPGSVVRTLFDSFAYEMAVLYEEMEQVYDASFIDTATESDLDKVVAILGIQRGEPEFATGTVAFERDLGIDTAIEIPIDTLVTTEDAEVTGGAVKKAYRTLESGTLQPDQASLEIKVKAEVPAEEGETAENTIVVMPQPIQGVKSVNNSVPIEFTGKRAETDRELRDRAKQTLLASSGSNTTAIEKALLSLPGVRAVKVSAVSDGKKNILPGQLSIVVDRQDFNEPELQATIERVRAAGVFHTLKQPVPQPIRGVFQVALRDEDKLSPDQKAEILATVKSAITDYVTSLPMSKPLVVAQLTRHLLNVPGVSDLTHFTLSPHNDLTDPGGNQPTSPPSRLPMPIPTEDYRVSLNPIRLAASKGVNVKISILLEWLALGGTVLIKKIGEIEEAFREKLKEALQAEESILRSYLGKGTSGSSKQAVILTKKKLIALSQAALQNIDSVKDKNNLEENPPSIDLQVQQWVKATDDSWQPYADKQDNSIQLDFIDNINITELNIGIAYARVLEISGGIQLILPPQMLESAQNVLIKGARENLKNYLAQLLPEADIEIPKLIEPIQAMDGVDGVIYEPKDFLANGTHDRLDERQQSIRVEQYEKPQLAEGFEITTKSEVVTITLTRLKLILKVSWPIDWIEQSQIDAQLDLAGRRTRLVDTVGNALTTAINLIAAKLPKELVTDSSVTDSSVTDSSVIDSSVIDSSVIDSSVIDSSVIDSSVIDSSVIEQLQNKTASLLNQAQTYRAALPEDDELGENINPALLSIESAIEPNSDSTNQELSTIQLPPLTRPYRPNVFNDQAVIDENRVTTADITQEVQQHRDATEEALKTYTQTLVEALFQQQSSVSVSVSWGLPAFPPGQDVDISQLRGALAEQFSIAVNKLNNAQILTLISLDSNLPIDRNLLATAINLALLNATFIINADSDIGLSSTAVSDPESSNQPVTYIRSTQTAQLAPINLTTEDLEISFQRQMTLS